MGTRNHPVVGADHTRLVDARVCRKRLGQVRRDGIVDIFLIVLAVSTPKRTPGAGHGGRAVHGRGIDIQICSQLGTDFGQNLFPGQRFQVVIVTKVFHHLSRDQCAVLVRPRPRYVVEESKFDGQSVAVAL